MKLYLSSFRLGYKPQELVSLVGKNKKAAVIANSTDFLTDNSIYDSGVQREMDDLRNLGFEPENVDLRDYFDKPDGLGKRLSEFGLLWVRGGNTFVLRRAFSESGFDKWLIGQKDNKE